MKKLLIVLLLVPLLGTAVQAQDWCGTKRASSQWQWDKIAISTGGQLLSIALEMSGDALRDMGRQSGNQSQQNWGHFLKATGYVTPIVTTTILVWDSKEQGRKMWQDISIQVITYGLNRYATADFFYNVVHPDYGILDVGSTSLYDQTMSEMPPHGRAVTKTWAFGLSLAITINYWR